MNRRSELMRDLEDGPSFEVKKMGAPVNTVVGAEAHLRRWGPISEEALRLVHQVFLGRTAEAPSVVVFAGMNHGSGCSEIARSVAETLAADPVRSVCLVEANFRSPSQSTGLDAGGWYGLTDALMRKAPIRSFMRPMDLKANLWLLPCGSIDPGSPALLSSGALPERIDELRSEFAFVIIDAPPVLQYADALALGQLANGLVLVVEAGKTRRDDAIQAVAGLRAARVSILAAVLNKETSPVPDRVLRRL